LGTKRAQRQALDDGVGKVLTGDRPRDPLLVIAAAVRQASLVDVTPALEEIHVSAALAAEGPPSIIARRPVRRSRPVAVGLVAAALLVLMASSAVAASSSALPGEALYGVKRAVERVRLSFPGGPAPKAQLHLEFADRRLAELQELLAQREAGEDVDVGAAMKAYGQELAKAERDAEEALALGSDDSFIEHVLARLDRHVQRLEFIRDNRVPEHARDAIQRAIDNAQMARSKVGHGRPEATGGGKPDGTPGRGPGGAPGLQQRAS